MVHLSDPGPRIELGLYPYQGYVISIILAGSTPGETRTRIIQLCAYRVETCANTEAYVTSIAEPRVSVKTLAHVGFAD